jgi:uncharacterized protein
MNDIVISSWFSNKVSIGPSKISGQGLFCQKKIYKDELIALKGGHTVTKKVFSRLPETCKHASLQIAPDTYIAPLQENEIARIMIYVNHSCNPNAGLKGQLATIAMRDIQPGEEITGDYCIVYSDEFFEFDCACGEMDCRSKVTSEDWEIPELQKKYDGYFSQYVQDKINARLKRDNL